MAKKAISIIIISLSACMSELVHSAETRVPKKLYQLDLIRVCQGWSKKLLKTKQIKKKKNIEE